MAAGITQEFAQPLFRRILRSSASACLPKKQRTSMDIPPEPPQRGSRPTAYSLALVVAGLLGVAILILSRIPPLVSVLVDSCRATRLCGPPPLKPLNPISTGFSKQSDWNVQSNPYLLKYQSENPDYDIKCIQTGEDHRSGAFNSNVENRYRGVCTGTPHWRGLFDIVGTCSARLFGAM